VITENNHLIFVHKWSPWDVFTLIKITIYTEFKKKCRYDTNKVTLLFQSNKNISWRLFPLRIIQIYNWHYDSTCKENVWENKISVHGIICRKKDSMDKNLRITIFSIGISMYVQIINDKNLRNEHAENFRWPERY